MQRFEERLAAAEAPQPRMERRLSELCGTCERLSARVEVMEAKLTESRRHLEEKLQAQKSDMEGRLQKSSLSNTHVVKATEEALLQQGSRLAQLEKLLPYHQGDRELHRHFETGLSDVHAKLEQTEQFTAALHQKHAEMEEQFGRRITHLVDKLNLSDNNGVRAKPTSRSIPEPLSDQVIAPSLRGSFTRRSSSAPCPVMKAAKRDQPLPRRSLSRILCRAQHVAEVLHDEIWSAEDRIKSPRITLSMPEPKAGEELDDGLFGATRSLKPDDFFESEEDADRMNIKPVSQPGEAEHALLQLSAESETPSLNEDLHMKIQSLVDHLTSLVPKVSSQECRLNEIEPRLADCEHAREQLADIVRKSHMSIREQITHLAQECGRLAHDDGRRKLFA